MSGHDKLRKAIDGTELALAHLQAFRWDDAVREIRANDYRSVLAAARRTLPETKMVEVWRVEYCAQWPSEWHAETANRYTREKAEKFADELRSNPARTCIRVTGPHQQEVPVDDLPIGQDA